MRLSAKAITTFNGINSYVTGNQWQIRANEPNTLYFQLVDLDQVNGACTLRYIPAAGATMTVTFPSIDDDAVVMATATQVSASDGSIWKVDLTASQVPASGNVIFALTEGAVTRRFSVVNLLGVEFPGNDGCC